MLFKLQTMHLACIITTFSTTFLSMNENGEHERERQRDGGRESERVKKKKKELIVVPCLCDQYAFLVTNK